MPPKNFEMELDSAIETTIDAWVESRREELLKCMVCEAGELLPDGTCDQCGAQTEI